MTRGPDNMEVVFNMRSASPCAYQNVYEDGDRWELVQVCSGCKANCCPPRCGMLVGGRCLAHSYANGQGATKPLGCCISPTPIGKMSPCTLVWKATRGKHKGMFRFKCDDRDKLRTGGPDVIS